MIKGKTIVLIATVAWGRNWQRQHEWASRLAANNRVLFVKPMGMTNMGPLTVLKKLRAESGFAYEHSLEPRIQKNLEHVRLPFIPLRNIGAINWLNARLMQRQLKRLGVTDGPETVLWICNPADTVVALTKRYPKSRVIYDIAMRFTLLPEAPHWISESQAELARRANAIIYDADAELKDLPTETHYKATYIPQGFDERILERVVEPHSSVAKLKPRAVYIGSGRLALDVDLLKKLMADYQDLELVVLGDFEPAPFTHPRVHWLGPVNRDQKDAYLTGSSVGLIPYVVNEYTAGTFPTKLFEYLALKIPVVSTALPEVAKFGEHVSVTSSADEFVSAVRQAVESAHSFDQEFLRAHSWRARFEQVERILDRLSP